MNPLEYFRVALVSLFQNKVRSLLTMLGVIIGVMSVILLVSFGEGAQAYVEKQFTEMGSNLLLITPGKQETSGMFPIIAGSHRPLTYADARAVKRQAVGITDISPMVMGAGKVRHHDRVRDTLVIGAIEAMRDVRNIHPRMGRFIEDADVDSNKRVAVLGMTVMRELFGNSNPLNQTLSINNSRHVVVGVLEPKGMTLGIDMDDMVIVPLTSAQYMFYGGEDRLFELAVQCRSDSDIEIAMESVREILIQRHDYTEDFTITDQTSMLSTFNAIFDALKIMLAGIASISLLVGGIGIMNIMLVSVRERTREVGIRKAVGARRSDIGLQFLIESVTLSCVGGIIGIMLGFGGTAFLRYLYPYFPVAASSWSIIMAFGFSTFVGVFFGVYPAMKAAAVDPVEALRYE